MEQILWKIEVAQSRVGGMTARLDTVMADNAARLPSMEEITLHEATNNMLTCGTRESSLSKDRSGPSSSVASFASELMKFNTGDDMVKLENEEGSRNQDVNIPTEEPRKRVSVCRLRFQ